MASLENQIIPIDESVPESAVEPTKESSSLASSEEGIIPIDETSSTNLKDFARGVAQGATLGGADEIYGAAAGSYSYLTDPKVREAMSLWEAYRAKQQEAETAAKESAARSPILYGAGNVAGGLATVPFTGAGIPGLIKAGAVAGALSSEGKLEEGPKQILDDTAKGALTGAVGGVGAAGLDAAAKIAGSGISAGGKTATEILAKPAAKLIYPFFPTEAKVAVNLASKLSSKTAETTANTASKGINALTDLPAQSIRAVAEKISAANPMLKSMTDGLIKAIDENNVPKKNAILFVLAQKPEARNIVDRLVFGKTEDNSKP